GPEGNLIASDQGGLLVGVGGAAHEAEQREVVDIAKGAASQSKLLARHGGQQAGAQRMLQWLARTEIGGQRKGGNELGEPDTSGAWNGHMSLDQGGDRPRSECSLSVAGCRQDTPANGSVKSRPRTRGEARSHPSRK